MADPKPKPKPNPNSRDNSITGYHACARENGWVDTVGCKVDNPWTIEGDEFTDAMKRVVLSVDFEQTDHMIVRYELTITITLTLTLPPP